MKPSRKKSGDFYHFYSFQELLKNRKVKDVCGACATKFFKCRRAGEKPIDINSYDKSIVDKLRLLDELDSIEKNSIFNIIDMAISKKRLKDMLSNALNVATL